MLIPCCNWRLHPVLGESRSDNGMGGMKMTSISEEAMRCVGNVAPNLTAQTWLYSKFGDYRQHFAQAGLIHQPVGGVDPHCITKRSGEWVDRLEVKCKCKHEGESLRISILFSSAYPLTHILSTASCSCFQLIRTRPRKHHLQSGISTGGTEASDVISELNWISSLNMCG